MEYPELVIGRRYLMLIHGKWELVTYELHWDTHEDNMTYRYGRPLKVYPLDDVIAIYEGRIVITKTGG